MEGPISIFDIFSIGVGPSSSHTLGPWRAAESFVQMLSDQAVDEIIVHLYGSLSKTGKGHATDIAIIMGLLCYDPVTIDVSCIDEYLDEVKQNKSITIHNQTVAFDPSTQIIFEDAAHERHPNTLIFQAYHDGELVSQEIFASVGGGFIENDRLSNAKVTPVVLPYPINHGEEIIHYTTQFNKSISDIVYANELAFRSEDEITQGIDDLLETMLQCIYLGCSDEGELLGGLRVKKRAKKLCQSLIGDKTYSNRDEWMDHIYAAPRDFNTINQFVSCFALAVNEQNASLSRVVTSPTNGAAGVIPAVLLYYLFFCDYKGKDSVRKFMMTAGEVGCLFKKGATISAAVGGCQAEIGVSSAMAAAGLTEVLGGSPEHCLMAAEIAMEHHLGLTCDPVGGLVQVPCIERNAMGAIKAITAANLALSSNPKDAIVNLDTVIKTMWDTAQDMHHKYKETSEGGLAFHLPVVMANC